MTLITATFGNEQEEEMNKWLENKFETSDPMKTRIPVFGSKGEYSDPKFCKHHSDVFGYVIVYKVETLELSDIKVLIETRLEPNATRDGNSYYEGTAGEISRILDVKSNVILNLLRDIKTKHPEILQYSGDGQIKPQVKYGKGLYWRILIGAAKKKLTFNKR